MSDRIACQAKTQQRTWAGTRSWCSRNAHGQRADHSLCRIHERLFDAWVTGIGFEKAVKLAKTKWEWL